MTKLFFFITLITAFSPAKSQDITATFHGGFSNYQGDLQEQYINLDQTGIALGLTLQYAILPKVNARLSFQYNKIKGADFASGKSGNPLRNLSFENKITELAIGGEYYLFNMRNKSWSPYLHAGISFFRHNPYAFDISGNKVFLEPLNTEGQGLPEYPTRSEYSLNELAIPFGGGIKVNITNTIKVGYELNFRKTFTDYLDDVSTTYPDVSTLLNRRGLKAVEMSYRGGEAFGGSLAFPAANSTRGSAKYKDWFYNQTITVGILLFSKNGGLFGSSNQYGTKCPSIF